MRILVLIIYLTASLWTGWAVAADAPVSEAEMKAEIFGWLAEQKADQGRKTSDLLDDTPVLKLKFQRLDCLKSNASGNANRGYSVAYDHTVMQSIAADKLQFIDNRYWLAPGCRFRSCPEASVIILDTQTRNIHFSLLHYLDWNRLFNNIWARQHGQEAFLSVFPDLETSPGELDRIVELTRQFARDHHVVYPGGKINYYLDKVPEPSVYAVSCM